MATHGTFGERFRFTVVTNEPALAAEADAAGVANIGPDLERLDKRLRQRAAGNRVSNHEVEDIARVRASVRRATVFVRLNPLNDETPYEIERALELGAGVLMLPYFGSAGEVERFVGRVAGRARVSLLLETAPAIVRIREILCVPGIDEVTVGLNDLHQDLRVNSHFEVLASPVLDTIAREAAAARLPLSVGGVASPDDLDLPVPADLVLAQYPRLGATGAWLSRSLLQRKPSAGIASAVAAIRSRLTYWAGQSDAALEEARTGLVRHVRNVAARA